MFSESRDKINRRNNNTTTQLLMKMMGYIAIMALLAFLMNSSGFYIRNLKRARYHVLKVSDELKVIRRALSSCPGRKG